MNKIKLVAIFVVLFVVGLMGFLLAKRFARTTQDRAAVVKSVRALSRWETSSYTLEKIIDSGSNGNVFQQFFFGNRILLIAHGEVIGGFDLSQFSAKDVAIHGSAIELTLPAPQIMVARIDNSQTRVYDRQKGLLVPSDNNLELDSLSAAQKSIQEAACKEGILTSASTNARSQLTSILSSFGFTNITIVIPPGHC